MSSIIIIIVLTVIIWKIIHGRKCVKTKGNIYSWRETLWPFDKTPFRLYKHLSPENKGAFWSLVSNIFICIITFWLGITLQCYINDKGQQYNERLTRYQIIDKFYPDYQQCVDSCSSVYSILQYANDERERNGIEKAYSILSEYLDNDSNYIEIDCAVEAAIEYYSKVLPYISKRDIADSIRKNNYKLFLGRRLLSNINPKICDSTTVFVDKTISLFSKSDSIKEVNRLIQECYALESKIGHSDSTTYICQKLYSLSKTMFLSRMFRTKEEGYKEAIIQFILYPMIANRKVIENEFLIQEPEITWEFSWENIRLILKDIRSIALFILLGCIFVGYILFRILMMRIFDRNSLKPNPILSQNDYDKLQCKIDSKERENKQKQINETALLTKIKSLEDDLISKKKEMEEFFMKQQSDLRKWQEKENEYIKELERVNKINEELNNRINKQQEET